MEEAIEARFIWRFVKRCMQLPPPLLLLLPLLPLPPLLLLLVLR